MSFKVNCAHRGGGTQHIRIRGGGVNPRNFHAAKNITSALLQPKNISSFYTYKPAHEHEISRKNANRSQDCLQRTQKYQLSDVWYQKISDPDIGLTSLHVHVISAPPPPLGLCKSMLIAELKNCSKLTCECVF